MKQIDSTEEMEGKTILKAGYEKDYYLKITFTDKTFMYLCGGYDGDAYILEKERKIHHST